MRHSRLMVPFLLSAPSECYLDSEGVCLTKMPAAMKKRTSLFDEMSVACYNLGQYEKLEKRKSSL